MSMQKRKTPSELPKLRRKCSQYTKQSIIRIPKRARNLLPRFQQTDLQNNSDKRALSPTTFYY